MNVLGELAILLGMKPDKKSMDQTRKAMVQHASETSREVRSKFDKSGSFAGSTVIEKSLSGLRSSAGGASGGGGGAGGIGMVGLGPAGAALLVAKMIADTIRAVAEGLRDVVEEAASYGLKINKLSHQLGISAQATQQWGYVAEQSGVSLEKLATGFRMLERNLLKMQQGSKSKSLQATFSALGISSTDVSKALKGGDGLNALMGQLSDKFKEMGDTPQRAALATQIFGARSSEILAAIDQGSESLSKLIRHYKELDVALSDTQVGSLKGLSNAIDDIHQQIDGTIRQAVADVAPMIIELLHQFTAWFSAHKPAIKELFEFVLKKAVEIAKALGKQIGRAFDWILEHKDEVIAGIQGIVEVIQFWIQVQGDIIASVVAVYDAVVRIAARLAKPFQDSADEIRRIFDALRNDVLDIIADIPIVGEKFAGKKLNKKGGGGVQHGLQAAQDDSHKAFHGAFHHGAAAAPAGKSAGTTVHVDARTTLTIVAKDIQAAVQAFDKHVDDKNQRSMRQAAQALNGGR